MTLVLFLKYVYNIDKNAQEAILGALLGYYDYLLRLLPACLFWLAVCLALI